MARTFNNNTANRLTLAQSVLAAGYPVSLHARIKPADVTAAHEQCIIRIGNTSAAPESGVTLEIYGPTPIVMANADGVYQAADAGATVSAGVWAYVGGVLTSAGSRTAYCNGIAGTPNTTSVDWAKYTPQGTSIGVWAGTGGGLANPFNGDIAEVAIWDTGLTASEFAALAAGLSPMRVRPGNLRAYWPLNDGAGSEANRATDKTFTLSLTGSVPLATHPAETGFVADGSLGILTTNQRYFTKNNQTGLVLAGGNFQQALVDRGTTLSVPADPTWQPYLDELASFGGNYIRLWVFDFSRVATSEFYAPLPWARTGPGNALDGGLKFDFNTWDTAYWTRLRSRIQYAGTKDVICSVMLFEGWSARFQAAPWRKDGHPMTSGNNINGISADQNANGFVEECYSRSVAAINTIQDAYVRKVVDETHDLPNVLYEICNEGDNIANANTWQAYWGSFIRDYQFSKPATYRHLIYRSSAGGAANDYAEVRWPGDVAAPSGGWSGYGNASSSPPHLSPVVTAQNVPRIYESDHLDGMNMTALGFWQAFAMGHGGCSYLDDPNRYFGAAAPYPVRIIKATLGAIVRFARKLDLTRCAPATALASTGYCLANAGAQYLVVQPASGAFTVDVSAVGATIPIGVEWFDPTTGVSIPGTSVLGGSATRSLTPPFATTGAVALLTVDQPDLRIENFKCVDAVSAGVISVSEKSR